MHTRAALFGLIAFVVFPFLSACNGDGDAPPAGTQEQGNFQISGQQLFDSDGAIDFGSVATGSSIRLTFTLVNTSEQSVHDIAATFSGAEFQFSGGIFPGAGGNCAVPVVAGATCVVNVTYTPSAAAGNGQSSSVLHVEYVQGTYDKASFFQDYAATHKSFDLDLVGEYFTTAVPQALLVIEPVDEFDFGDHASGTITTQDFTLHNVGTVDASAIMAPMFSNPVLYLSTGCGETLAAGAACGFRIQFQPTVEGGPVSVPIDTTKSFTYNDGAGGSGTTPLHILGTGKKRAQLTLTGGSTSFGLQPVGSVTPATLTYTNDGGTPATALVWNPFPSANGFSFSSGGTCTTTLAVGDSCTVVVTFTPGTTGPLSDTALITFNDGFGTNNASLSASGTGATEPSLAISAVGPSDFDDTYVGDSRSQQYLLTNNGQWPATSVTGSIAEAGFTFDGGFNGGTCTGTLAGGASCTFSVKFTPFDHGFFHGCPTVHFKNSHGANRHTYIALQGLGTKAGDLDRHFGWYGTFVYAVGGYDDEVQASVVQPDGKIVLAGYSANLVSHDFMLVRLNTDGTLDTSFYDPGASPFPGAVITNFGTADAEIRGLALQTISGVTKIIAVGTVLNGGTLKDFAIARYTLNGSLDASFGTGGITFTDFNGKADIANAVAVRADGKIVVAGQARFAGPITKFAIARYTVDGVLDSGAGGFGKLSGGVPTGKNVVTIDAAGSQAYALALVPGTEEVVVAGESYPDDVTKHFALAKFSADGVLDTSFGSGGTVSQIVRTSVPAPIDTARGIVILPSGADTGKIVLGGFSFGASGNMNRADFAFARFTAAGALDTASGFGDSGGGTVIDSLGSGNDKFFSMLMQADQKLVLGGRRGLAGSGDFAIARYSALGARDTSFADTGMVVIDGSLGLPGTDDFGATLVEVQKNGRNRLMLSGYSDSTATGGSIQLGSIMVWE